MTIQIRRGQRKTIFQKLGAICFCRRQHNISMGSILLQVKCNFLRKGPSFIFKMSLRSRMITELDPQPIQSTIRYVRGTADGQPSCVLF